MDRQRLLRALPAAVIAAGIALRLRQYLFNRSLWLDEAGIALNITQKPLADLLKPLAHEQAAPFGFLAAIKALVSVAGDGDMALRLLPFLAGVASLPFLHMLARRFMGPMAALLATALLAFSDTALYYSTELKPYMVDAFAALVLLAAFLRCRRTGAVIDDLLFAAACSLALWCSYPALFVAGGLGAALVAGTPAGRKAALARRIGCGAVVIASFAAYYLLSLRHLGRSDYMQQYWQGHFAPLPLSLDDFNWHFSAFTNAFSDPGSIALGGIGALLFLTGAIALARTDRYALAGLLGPLVFLVVASIAGRYPIHGRMLLFYVPFALILVGAGFEHILELPQGGRTIAAVAAALVLYQPLAGSIIRLTEPITKQEMKPVLSFIKANRRPGDLVAVHHSAARIFEYYAPRYGFLPDDIVTDIRPRGNPAEYSAALAKLRRRPRVWALFTDFRKDDNQLLLYWLESAGSKAAEKTAPGVEGYLYLMRQSR